MRRIDAMRIFPALFLSAAPASAVAQAVRDDAATLRGTLPAVGLGAKPDVDAAFRPYIDCYARSVERSRQSSLKTDDDVRGAELSARERCGQLAASAMAAADARVAAASPDLSPAERAGMLRDIRRQLSVFGVARRYREAGRAPVFQRYLERLGREGRAGRPVAMLTGG